MTFEARLQSIDETLKALLVAFQTGVAAQHAFGAPDAHTAAAKLGRKPKAEPAPAPAVDTAPAPAVDTALGLPGVPSKDTDLLGLVDGHPSGTRYWVIEAHNTVYAQTPGLPDPQVASAKITTAADYLEKKAEYAKKSVIPPVAVVPTTPAAAVPETAANAQTASSSAATPSFDEVTKLLKQLGSDTREGLGRPALVALVNKYLPADAELRNVPALAALGKNSEIYAEATALLNLVPKSEEDIFA